MPLHRWSREHASALVARVDPADDSRWIVSIWQGEQCVETLRRRFQLLTDAQARADERLLELFQHECEGAQCSRHWKRGASIAKSQQ